MTNMPNLDTSEILNGIKKILKQQPSTLTLPKITCGLYTRLSKFDPRKPGYSMDELQHNGPTDYAQRQGWTIYKEYPDPDRSARNSKRDGLQNMLKDIKAGKINVVISHRFDRLYRNLKSLIELVDILEHYNVRLVSLHENIDTNTSEGRMMLYFCGAFAEMYLRNVSTYTREAKTARARRGLSNGNLPLGFCRGNCSTCTDPNGKDYCPNFGRADLGDGRISIHHPIDSHGIKLIVKLSAERLSHREIADHINRNRFRLPDGAEVQFRSRGIPGRCPPGKFTRDTIREILRNPFYVGLVARYERPPLDMRDEVNNPQKKYKPFTVDSRHPIELIQGQHEPIYDIEVWQQNQRLQERKGATPTSNAKPKRQSPLHDRARCAICYEWDGRISNLRMITNSQGYAGLRCALLQDYYASHRKEPAKFTKVEREVGLQAQPYGSDEELIKLHNSFINLSPIMHTINQIVGQLRIPPDWREQIATYYLGDERIAEFKREDYILQQLLQRKQKLFITGHITSAEFERQSEQIARDITRLKPSRQSEASTILPMLSDFQSLWAEMTQEEQTSLLRIIFTDLFFDKTGQLTLARANSPFDELLQLPQKH